MAIDYTGISSIDAGAHDITYSGNEGPKSPEENREIALAILGDEAGEIASQLWNGMSPSEKSEWRSIEGFIQSDDFKIILMKLQSSQQEGRGGIQMATAADPMLQEEYDKYVFEMQEQGLEPMSLEDFRQQAVAGMATGGRVGLANGQLVQPTRHGVRPGYRGDAASVAAEKREKEYGQKSSRPGPDPREKDRRDPGDGPKSKVAPPPYIPPDKKELEEIFKEPKKEKAKDKIKLPIWATIKGIEKTHNAWRRKRFLENYMKKNAVEFEQGMGMFPEGLLGWENWDKDDWNTKQAREWLDELGYADTLKGPEPIGADDTPGGKFWNQGIAAIPEWQRLGYPSHAAWLAAQGTGTTTQQQQQQQQQAASTGPFQVASLSQADLDRLYGTSIPTTGTVGWTRPSPNILQYQAVADGGRAGYAGGGIADLRQGYFLGKIVKSITKPFKKALKSPLGKIALAGLGMYLTRGMGPMGKAGGWKNLLFGQTAASQAARGFPELAATKGLLGKWGLTGGYGGMMPTALGGILGASALGGVYTGLTQKDDEDEMFKKWLAEKQAADDWWIPKFEAAFPAADGGRIGYKDAGDVDSVKKAILEGILNGTLTFEDLIRYEKTGELPKERKIPRDRRKWLEDIKDLDWSKVEPVPMPGSEPIPLHPDATTLNLHQDITPWKTMEFRDENQDGIEDRSQGIYKDRDIIPWDPDRELKEWRGPKDKSRLDKLKKMFEENRAQGGRIGYNEGGNDKDHRKAALAELYKPRMQEGGLMDLGGMEKDYRNDGGFVPIGGQERADDVPARLSRNEFVFTADAVRAAGGGDIDKGAEVMENVMENLENGGNISEESQGLEGARDMFATSQRLEGVL